MINKEINMKNYQNGQLPIIGIHATILSILIAIFSAYSFHVHNVIQNMELEVINTAEKINKITFLRYSYLPSNDFPLPEETKEIIHNFTHIFLLLSNTPHDAQDLKEYEIPKDPSERPEKAIQLMNVIAHRYPFPNALWKTESGWSQKSPEPIVFGNMNDVSNWLLDLNEILKVTGLFRNIPDKFLSEKYLEYFRSLEKTKEELIQRARNDTILQIMGIIEPRIIFSNFIEGLNRAEEISLETEYKLRKIEEYRKSRLSRTILRLSIVTTGIVFIISVIVPIVFKGASRVFWIFIPSGYYLIVFIYILIESF